MNIVSKRKNLKMNKLIEKKKRKNIMYIVSKFIYSKIYNIKSFQVKCGIMAETFKVCVNFFDYKTGSSLNLTTNEYHMFLCKIDTIIEEIEDQREEQKNDENGMNNCQDMTENKENIENPKMKKKKFKKNYQISEFLKMRCRLNDGEEQNIKLTLSHVYTKQTILMTYNEFLELHLLRFNILQKINESSQIHGNIIEF